MEATVENPLSKERIVFRHSHPELFAMDIYVAPGGGIRAPDHIHPLQEERLRVVAGAARFRLDGAEQRAAAGETVIVPAGVAHTWENDGPDQLQLEVEYRPGLESAKTFFRNYFGWAQEGKLKGNGRPPLLDWALLFCETQDFIAVARVPIGVQRLLARLLAPIARARGHRLR
jgi:quercetin dioxygenase-like cupin family protein